WDQKQRSELRWRWVGAVSMISVGVVVVGGTLLLLPEYYHTLLVLSDDIIDPERAFETQLFKLILELASTCFLMLLATVGYMRGDRHNGDAS
ncbi:MAG: hypothetical protein AAFR01_04845, partial [Pseudomonadota bacterium]